jgi:hypothetical protein
MEAEKSLKPDEFARLPKAAKDDRERCILLLMAGAGLASRRDDPDQGKWI